MTRIALLCVAAVCARAQEFEAASIRPPSETPTRCIGGPGTQDTGRLACENFPVAWLVMMAYNIRPFQFSAPDWTVRARFNFQATLPPDSAAEQFRAMLRHLLAARFKLAVHFEKKELEGYDMVLVKKSENLKPSTEGARVPAEPSWLRPVTGPPVRVRAQFNGVNQSMARLAAFVSDRLDRPVADATGLSGGFDFVLRYSDGPPGPSVTTDDDPGLSVEDALREQLGLGLVKKKVQAEVLVIDHIEKTPVDN